MAVVELRKSTGLFYFLGSPTEFFSGDSNGNEMNLLEESYGVLVVVFSNPDSETGSFEFQATHDGETWFAVEGISVLDHTVYATDITDPASGDAYRLDVSGFAKFRVASQDVSADTSGMKVTGLGQSY